MRAIDNKNKHSNLITRVLEAKKRLDQLEINWETDVGKMEFDKLRADYNLKISYSDLEISKIKVDYSDGLNYDNFDDLLSFMWQPPEVMLNLLEFIMSGKKVIPPMYVSNYEIKNGVKIKNTNLFLHDGNHRIRVAQYIGLLEIPIVINNWNASITFSISEITMTRHNNYDKVRHKETDYFFEHYRWNIEALTKEIITFSRIGRTTVENGKRFVDYT